MSEDALIPKDLKTRPMRNSGSEVAALNALLATINNPAITGAQVPPGEEVLLKVPPGASLLPSSEKAPAPAPEPTKQQATEDALDKAIARVKGPTNRPLIVLTGRSGVGKSFLQARLRGTRNVVAGISEAADFRALREAGAEFWHIMASEDTLARRRAPGAAKRPANPLVLTLDADANKKLTALPPGGRLHVVWNDTVQAPYQGVYNVTAFLNEVS